MLVELAMLEFYKSIKILFQILLFFQMSTQNITNYEMLHNIDENDEKLCVLLERKKEQII